MNIGDDPNASDGDDAGLAVACAALGHPVRLAILRQLDQRDACCCKDVVKRIGLAQSTVSQHLKVLVEAGLVSYSPDRQKSRYALDRDALHNLGASLSRLMAPAAREDQSGG